MNHPRDTGYDRSAQEWVQLDTTHPADVTEPIPLPDDSCERAAMVNGIMWAVDLVGCGKDSSSIVTKILALRYLLHQSSESLEDLGRPFGISKQRIDRWIKVYANAFSIPRMREAARSVYSVRSKRVWKRRKLQTQRTGGA
jgi:DNA-directed RNA polymerase sigma subunit (sigma70/sigma32)